MSWMEKEKEWREGERESERACASVVARGAFPAQLARGPPGPAELAQGHRASRPRGTGPVGDSVGEGPAKAITLLHASCC